MGSKIGKDLTCYFKKNVEISMTHALTSLCFYSKIVMVMREIVYSIISLLIKVKTLSSTMSNLLKG